VPVSAVQAATAATTENIIESFFSIFSPFYVASLLVIAMTLVVSLAVFVAEFKSAIPHYRKNEVNVA
jgi:hypothetical protein